MICHAYTLKRHFLTLILCWFATSGASWAALNDCRGLWPMSGNANSLYPWQPGLTTAGGISVTYPQVTVGLGTNQVMNLPALTAAQSIKLSNWAGSNGGAGVNGGGSATKTNRWTLLMDIKPTFVANKPWVSILQTTVANNDDADFFIKNDGTFWMPGGALTPTTPVPAGVWSRLAITSENDGAGGTLTIRVFLNGVQIAARAGQALDGPMAIGPEALLFSDDNGDTNAIQVAAVGYWTETLSAATLGTFGSSKPDDLDWTGRPVPGPTVMPGLSGDLAFGSFDLELPGATTGFYVVNGAVVLNNPATVPGLTGFSVSGIIPVKLTSFGDLAFTGTSMTLSGPAGGTTSINNVGIRTGTVTLTPAGATASGYVLVLPIGLGVSDSMKSRRLKNETVPRSRALRTGLMPNLAFDPYGPQDFGYAAGTPLYFSHESLPVRLRTSGIEWQPDTAGFTISSITGATFDRGLERKIYQEWDSITGVQTAGDLRPSNDDYFSAVRAAVPDVYFKANANGIAELRDVELTMDTSLASAGFRPHFPQGPLLRWSGTGASTYKLVDGAHAANSYLYEGLQTTMNVPRACPDSKCPPGAEAGPATFSFLPPDHWVFTSDGGLRAECDVAGGALEWGSITPTTFAHKITGMTNAWFMMPGCRLRGTEMAGTPIQDRPAALLLSGLGNIQNYSAQERPGKTGYESGITDYAGLNFRVTTDGAKTATSVLGGTQLNYPLRGISKYYVRNSGLTGRHEAVTDPVGPGELYPVSTVIAGYQFGLSEVRLSFLDGENLDSAINGALDIPPPADLPALTFKNLRFGCRGELQSAQQTSPPDLTLAYWKTNIKAYAFEFALPAGDCPDPTQSTLVLGVSASLPALTDSPFYGSIGLKANGHTVTPADAMVLPNGQAITSRLRPPPNFKIKGPGAKTYAFVPAGPGAYLNEFSGASAPGGLACVAVTGQMDVPFFKDLKVLLRAQSAASAGAGSSLQVVQGDATGADFFGDVEVDANNSTRPDITAGPRARKLWLDLVSLDYPLNWDNTLRRFKGTDVTNDVLLFKLNQRAKALGPEIADLTFGASVASLPQINVATLLDAAGADTSGLMAGITAKFGGTNPLAVPLTKLTEFEQLLGDTLGSALDGPLNTAIAPSAGVLYDQLAASYAVNPATYRTDPSQTLSALTAAYGSATSTLSSLVNGTGGWTMAITSRIQSALDAVNSLKTFAQTADNFGKLAAAALNQSSAPASSPIAELSAEILQSLNELGARLTELKIQFSASGDLQAELSAALSNTIWVNSFINEFSKSWISGLDDPTGNFFPPTGSAAATALRASFVSSYQAAFREAVHASPTEKSIRQLLAYGLSDAGLQLRGAFDGIMQGANELAQTTQPPLPDISGMNPTNAISSAFQGAKIQGYARINGDSLNELRLDGELKLKMPDDMVFRSWFILRDMDATTPGGACLAAGGMKTEVTVGAAAPLTWLGKTINVEAEARVGIGDSGTPVSVAGGLGMKGEFDLESITIKEAQLGLAIGQPEAYLYAKAAGSLYTGAFAMDAEVALFMGKTCRLDPIEKVDAGVATLLTNAGFAAPTEAAPLYGLYGYAYGNFSVLSLIGIPPSCLLDLRVGGGQGNLIFYRDAALMAGMKTTYSVSGEALCLVNVGGRLDGYLAGILDPATPAKTDLKSLKATGRLVATLTGEIGFDPFSYEFKKAFNVDMMLNPFASPKLKWSINY